MPMTLVVTRDVDYRHRGFLASVMLEIAPGVYTNPQMSAAIRDRVWKVMSDWHSQLGRGSIVLTWQDKREPGGQGIRFLGEPSKSIVDLDGVLIVQRRPPAGGTDESAL